MSISAIPRGEKLIPLGEARKIIKARTGRRVDMSTVWRWAMHGLKGVKLEHVRAGRELRTTAESLDRFYQRLAEAYQQKPVVSVDHHAHARAEAELDAAGV